MERGSARDVHVELATLNAQDSSPHEAHTTHHHTQSTQSEFTWQGSTESQSDARGERNICAVPKEIRAGFIKKVYTILVVMLAVTTCIAAPFTTEPVIHWVYQHQWLGKLCGLFSLMLIFALSCCCQDALRVAPQNYILAFLYVVLTSVVIGFVISLFKLESVLLAAGMTTAIFLSLTAYACCTRSDLTGMGPYIYCALVGLMLGGAVLYVFHIVAESTLVPHLPRVVDQIWGVLGAIVFSLFIVYDTQRIMGGKRLEVDIDDYMWAALELYLDIINLFIMILEIFGDRGDS